jgi:hypothetical protein
MNTSDAPTPNEDAKPQGSADHSAPVAVSVPGFDARRLGRQLLRDTLIRWTVALAMGLCLMSGLMMNESSLWSASALIMAGLLLWIWLSSVSAKVWQGLKQITAQLRSDPAQAETRLAQYLRRMPLHRSARLLLYHRMAILRHRQRRFAEVASICHSLLSYQMGPAERVRPHLLLLLVEASLAEKDHVSAYLGLTQLCAAPLNLIESLQCMALRTRYELAVGHYESALVDVGHKVELAEMMPAPQCGVMHAMLAAAAAAAPGKQPALADWLWRRAELFCGSERLEELACSGGFLDMPGMTVSV